MDHRLLHANLPLRRRCFYLTDMEFLSSIMQNPRLGVDAPRADGAEGGDTVGDRPFLEAVDHLLEQFCDGDAVMRECSETSYVHEASRLLRDVLRARGCTTDASATQKALHAWGEFVEALLCGLESTQPTEQEKTAARRLLGVYVRAFYVAGKAFYTAADAVRRERAEEGRGRSGGNDDDDDADVRVTWSIGAPLQHRVYHLLNPL